MRSTTQTSRWSVLCIHANGSSEEVVLSLRFYYLCFICGPVFANERRLWILELQ